MSQPKLLKQSQNVKIFGFSTSHQLLNPPFFSHRSVVRLLDPFQSWLTRRQSSGFHLFTPHTDTHTRAPKHTHIHRFSSSDSAPTPSSPQFLKNPSLQVRTTSHAFRFWPLSWLQFAFLFGLKTDHASCLPIVLSDLNVGSYPWSPSGERLRQRRSVAGRSPSHWGQLPETVQIPRFLVEIANGRTGADSYLEKQIVRQIETPDIHTSAEYFLYLRVSNKNKRLCFRKLYNCSMIYKRSGWLTKSQRSNNKNITRVFRITSSCNFQ